MRSLYQGYLGLNQGYVASREEENCADFFICKNKQAINPYINLNKTIRKELK